jgi:hypothetical protein
MKRIVIAIVIVFVLLISIVISVVIHNIRDRHSGYELDLSLPQKISEESERQLKIGLAKVPITPKVEDTWIDADSNARYEPSKGDSFVDNNGNGEFDAYWLAGFQNNRPAAGIHDDIWARTVIWDNGDLCIALVSIDAIGLFHDDVIEVRKMVAEKKLGIDHVIIAATHSHEVPDLMGLWGPKIYKSGVNDDYLEFVKQQMVLSIATAFENRKPALIKLSRIDSSASDLVRDSRPPQIMDDALHLMQFCDVQSKLPFGILINWGNHPETLGSKNLLITSDFCHYWLKGIEEGIIYENDVKRYGIAGTAIFVNGAIGGLMTSLGCNIYDPWLDISFKEASMEKARAQGYRLADLVLDQIESGEWEIIKNPIMQLRVKTFLFKLENTNFKIGGALGIFHRGFIKFNYLRSEVNLLTIGPAWILTIPGEINPEIVNGGIEVPDGADFPGEAIEVPPLRQLMQGEYNFVIGLANDEVGYIMPKTHWDVEKPYTYGASRPFYGEINSLDPEAGPKLYQEAKSLIEEVKSSYGKTFE